MLYVSVKRKMCTIYNGYLLLPKGKAARRTRGRDVTVDYRQRPNNLSGVQRQRHTSPPFHFSHENRRVVNGRIRRRVSE